MEQTFVLRLGNTIKTFTNSSGRWFETTESAICDNRTTKRVLSWELANKLNDMIAEGWEPCD